jgi:hypothetical protein
MTGIIAGLGGLLVLAVVALIAYKLLKSLVKATMVGVVVLLLLGAWIAYSLGYLG